MSGKLLALLIAAAAGMLMAMQGSLNAALSKMIGLLETTFVVHLVGLVLVGILLFALGLGDGQLSQFARSPWYTYLGGVLGVLIVYGVVCSIPKVGVAPATTAIILGQVFTATVIDHFGLLGMERLPFTWYRVAGMLLMAGGAWLLLKK
ncbi:MAG TPA: hypothetical protein DCM26_05350 [Desulfotomaculum sp.]|nr:hypothetical protein [Desulfotomaculum sp.]